MPSMPDWDLTPRRARDSEVELVQLMTLVDANNVGNNLARLLDNDRVADSDVFTGNLFDVVQSDSTDGGSGDLHGLQIRCRR